MRNRITSSIANVLFASVGTVVFTTNKVSKGYKVVVEEGKKFTGEIKTAYQSRRADKAIKDIPCTLDKGI